MDAPHRFRVPRRESETRESGCKFCGLQPCSARSRRTSSRQKGEEEDSAQGKPRMSEVKSLVEVVYTFRLKNVQAEQPSC